MDSRKFQSPGIFIRKEVRSISRWLINRKLQRGVSDASDKLYLTERSGQQSLAWKNHETGREMN